MAVLDAPVDVVDTAGALARMAEWARKRESRVVCACNVHSVVTARSDPLFMDALRQADLVVPDGEPVAWLLRSQGAKGQSRVSGPDLMLDYCAHAAAVQEPVYLYGSTAATLDKLQSKLKERWPTLRIAGAHAPPFRALTPEEEAQAVERINKSGAHTVWVSLGCPKQELWMARQRGKVQAVMVGIGAAADFHAGTRRRAPKWMQQRGLEWLHRMASEPGRLGERYLTTNVAFLWAAAGQWMGLRKPPR
jgi:N-acetylglucosaminyldiphosphoundecaprenol N-acetyl-beta-D-mannosaminyltransferase